MRNKSEANVFPGEDDFFVSHSQSVGMCFSVRWSFNNFAELLRCGHRLVLPMCSSVSGALGVSFPACKGARGIRIATGRYHWSSFVKFQLGYRSGSFGQGVPGILPGVFDLQFAIRLGILSRFRQAKGVFRIKWRRAKT